MEKKIIKKTELESNESILSFVNSLLDSDQVINSDSYETLLRQYYKSQKEKGEKIDFNFLEQIEKVAQTIARGRIGKITKLSPQVFFEWLGGALTAKATGIWALVLANYTIYPTKLLINILKGEKVVDAPKDLDIPKIKSFIKEVMSKYSPSGAATTESINTYRLLQIILLNRQFMEKQKRKI